MLKKLLMAAIAMVMVVSAGYSMALANESDLLLGRWILETVDGVSTYDLYGDVIEITFFPNGMALVISENPLWPTEIEGVFWFVENGRLFLDDGWRPDVFDYLIDGDSLTISDDHEILVFARAGAAEAPEGVVLDENLFGSWIIIDLIGLPFEYLDDINLEFIFLERGIMLIFMEEVGWFSDVEAVLWSAENNALTTYHWGHPETLTYSIDGDRLYIYEDDVIMVFMRASELPLDAALFGVWEVVLEDIGLPQDLLDALPWELRFFPNGILVQYGFGEEEEFTWFTEEGRLYIDFDADEIAVLYYFIVGENLTIIPQEDEGDKITFVRVGGAVSRGPSLDEELFGKWRAIEVSDMTMAEMAVMTMEFTFFIDGSLLMRLEDRSWRDVDYETALWSVNGGRLTIDDGWRPETLDYYIEGNRLTIFDMDERVVFIRVE